MARRWSTHPEPSGYYESLYERAREEIEDEVPLDYPLWKRDHFEGTSTPQVVATLLDRLPNELHAQASELLDAWCEIRVTELEPGEDLW